MEQLQINTLPDILTRKVNAGVEKLNKTPIDDPAYNQLLQNIEASMSLLARLTIPPIKPKPNDQN